LSFTDQFNIKFSGLNDGVHFFDFEIEKLFFEKFENTEAENAKVHVKVEMIKQSNMLTFNLAIDGFINLTCDRCLDNFDFRVNNNFTFFVKFGKSTYEESDDVIVLSETEHQINIAQYIYEYIMLCIPAKVTHPDNEKGESTCNKDFLKKLKELEPKANATTDLRWDMLKNLKENKN